MWDEKACTVNKVKGSLRWFGSSRESEGLQHEEQERRCHAASRPHEEGDGERGCEATRDDDLILSAILSADGPCEDLTTHTHTQHHTHIHTHTHMAR